MRARHSHFWAGFFAHATGAAMVAVVALTGCGTDGASSAGNAQKAETQGTTSWAVGASTLSASAHLVQQLVTATDVDRSGAPMHPTSRFRVDRPIYVVGMVRGVGHGETHRLSVRWFLNDTLAQAPGARSSMTVTHDGPVSFGLVYPAAGSGTARLYWDEPIGDNSDRPNEAFLIATIAFTVR